MNSRPDSNGLSAWGDTPRPRGAAVLADPLLNKGTAFTERERDLLGLRRMRQHFRAYIGQPSMQPQRIYPLSGDCWFVV